MIPNATAAQIHAGVPDSDEDPAAATDPWSGKVSSTSDVLFTNPLVMVIAACHGPAGRAASSVKVTFPVWPGAMEPPDPLTGVLEIPPGPPESSTVPLGSRARPPVFVTSARTLRCARVAACRGDAADLQIGRRTVSGTDREVGADSGSADVLDTRPGRCRGGLRPYDGVLLTFGGVRWNRDGHHRFGCGVGSERDVRRCHGHPRRQFVDGTVVTHFEAAVVRSDRGGGGVQRHRLFLIAAVADLDAPGDCGARRQVVDDVRHRSWVVL